MQGNVPFKLRVGGVEILSHKCLRAKWVRNQVSRKKPVLTLIKTNAISTPVVCENTSVDPAEAQSHSVYVPYVCHVKIRAKSPFDILFWEHKLRSHTDPLFVQIILDGIRFGVK